MFTRYLIAALAAFTLATGAFGAWQYRIAAQRGARIAELHQEARELRTALEASVASRDRADKAALSRAKKAQVTAKHQKDSNETLDEAVKASPDWAEQPLPPGIAEWLRNRATASPGSAAGAPASVPAP